ncbi:unnamed protein product [Schistosoma curassoni]|uniref:Casc1_N domain-containing protein n=1 Tax=Schistosoma curassoni TaxID=6186 RepID=A0A183KNK5_9TREM|nr:unnamed protein product [Schistosoma curassoni]
MFTIGQYILFVLLCSVITVDTQTFENLKASQTAKRNKDSNKKINDVDETRLKELEEERERLRKEKELELRKALQEKEDHKIRVEELKQTRILISQLNKRLHQLEIQCHDQYTWERYFQCNDLPNPTNEREINTYISLWNSDEQHLSIEDVMNDCIKSFKIIDELNLLISELTDHDEDQLHLFKYNHMIHELRQQIDEKLDRSIIDLLTKAIYYKDHETLNLQKIWYNHWIVLCIWGNLSKNPRYIIVYYYYYYYYFDSAMRRQSLSELCDDRFAQYISNSLITHNVLVKSIYICRVETCIYLSKMEVGRTISWIG